MATKNIMTDEKLRKAKADDAVVYKVMAALVLLCASLTALRALRAYYETVGGFTALYDLTLWIALGGVGLVVVAGLLMLWKNKVIRVIMPWVMVIGCIVAATGLSMYTSWVEGFPALYFLCCAALIQYIVFLLYRWEFFLFSLSTVVTGGMFFTFSDGFVLGAKNLLLIAGVVLVLCATAACAFLASRNKGVLVLGKKNYRMFPSKFNPSLIYIVDALWLVCTILALILGGLFCYYCMFAAIAVEFIAAVYYTFQLN